MAKPMVAHPSLGTLVFDEEYTWWTCRAEIRPGYSTDFCLSTRTGTAPQIDTLELLERGAHYLEWVRRSEETIRHRAAEEFTGPYNDFWSDAFGPLTMEQVKSRISLASIELHIDGSAYWYYSDGNLFAGHLIEVRVDASHNVTELLLAG